MFDVGLFEMLLISVVALLVLGPKRLPRAARTVGLWVRRARASWFSLRAEMERELADEDLKASLHEARDEMRALKRELEAPLDPRPVQPVSVQPAPVQAVPAQTVSPQQSVESGGDQPVSITPASAPSGSH